MQLSLFLIYQLVVKIDDLTQTQHKYLSAMCYKKNTAEDSSLYRTSVGKSNTRPSKLDYETKLSRYTSDSTKTANLKF